MRHSHKFQILSIFQNHNQLNLTMKRSLGDGEEFSLYDEISQIQTNNGGNEAFSMEKNEIQTKTQYYESRGQLQLVCRSRKNKRKDSFEISFESDILKAHFQAIEVLISSYFKNSFSVLSFQQQSQGRDYYSISQNQQTEKLKQILSCSSLVPKQMIEQFLKDLEGEKNLTKFLMILISACPQKLKTFLLGIAYLVWEKYLQVAHELFSQNSQKFLKRLLWEIEESFSQTLKDHLAFLKASLRESIDQKKLEEFVLKFTETIYLVIEEYFDNPYAASVEGQFKAQLNPLSLSTKTEFEQEWENGFQNVGKKKKIR